MTWSRNQDLSDAECSRGRAAISHVTDLRDGVCPAGFMIRPRAVGRAAWRRAHPPPLPQGSRAQPERMSRAS